MKMKITQETLTAYALDELDPDEVKRVEDAVNGDAGLRSQLDEIRRAAKICMDVMSGASGGLVLTDEQRGKVLDSAREAQGESLFEAGEDIEIDISDEAGPPISGKGVSGGGESSILFSLSNLQALASGGSEAGGDAPATGFVAGSEVSGLVDIRSMVGIRDSQARIVDEEFFSINDVGFGANMGAPVLAPSLRGEGMSTGAKVGIGVGVLAVAACVAVVLAITMRPAPEEGDNSVQDEQIALLMKQLEELKTSGGSDQDMAALQDQLNKAEKAKTDDGASEEGEGSEDGEGSSKEPAKAASKSSSSSAKGSGPAKSSAKSSGSSASGSSGGAGAGSSSKPSSGKKVDELDDLLGGSAKGPPKKKESKPASGGGGGSVPKTLSRTQVQSGMNAVAASVKRCGAGEGPGTVNVQVTIAGNGRVTSAVATSPHAGTALGACAARAVKKARFPQFQNHDLKVKYPFKY